MPAYNSLDKCPIDGQNERITYVNFGLMPLVNNLNDTMDDSIMCNKYSLAVNYYPKTKLSMLSMAISPEILFSNYLYKSGTSKPYIDHCKGMYDCISQLVSLKDNDLFIDVGGNDGTLLASFKDKSHFKIKVLNIDPSVNLAKSSIEKGVDTITDLWTSKLAQSLSSNFKAKVITSTNVFQHTEPIRDFVRGIRSMLAEDGVWCLEFPYWGNDLATNQYDQIYHEHIYYYLLTPLFDLFKQEGLEIVNVSKQSIHGGTLRVISRLQKVEGSVIPASVESILASEKMFDDDFHRQWGQKVSQHISESKKLISDLKNAGKKIAGFGAAAKGCTWLNATGLNYKTFDYVVDDTDVKQGKYIPGTGVQIVNRETLVSNPPDYLVILAHNFADYIRESVKPIYKGNFIKMFPSPVIYE